MTNIPEFFNFTTDVFNAWTKQRPNSLALLWVNEERTKERRLTFAEMSELSQRAAQTFLKEGIQPGQPVIIMLHRVPEWWVAMLGLTLIGAIPIPCTPQLTPHDLEYRIETGGIQAILTDAEGTEKLQNFTGKRWQTGGGELVSGWKDFDQALTVPVTELSITPTRATDPGIIYFTSATTGGPKMVLHTQASYGIGHAVTGKLWLNLKPGDLHWNTSDLGWAKAAWSSFYGPWQCGAGLFVWDARGKFSASQALDVLAQYPITTLCAPPTALRMMIREDFSNRSFPHLRHCVTAGEPLNPSVFHEWKEATGLDIYEGYGQTETVILLGHFRDSTHPVIPGSMGRPTPGYHICLIDEHQQPVHDGEEGEIAVRLSENTPIGIFKEYWKSPKETAEHFCNGWYLTGDRATRDKDGYFWFVGRKDDVIKSSGYRIGPFEVESALTAHTSVLEAAVVGKPDDVRGQIVKAFVVLRPGHVASDELCHKLQDHCKHLVAPYKYPREIEFVSELPKTVSGKTRRVELRHKELKKQSSPC